MSTVITPFQGTDSFSTATFNNRISQINTGFSYISNPNLLDNWYFGNPVDQRQGRVVKPNTTYYSDNQLTTSAGTTSAYATAYRYATGTASGVNYASFKLEDTDTAPTYYAAPENVVRGYIGYVYGIDRWRTLVSGGSDIPVVTVENDGLVIRGNGNTHLWQGGTVEDIPSGTYTLSLLVSELYGTCKMACYGAKASILLAVGLNTITFTLKDSNTSRGLFLLNYLNGTIKVKAAKLELGSQQTLAHQDENGVWVLNEIPDYGEQLARCQRVLIPVLPWVCYSGRIDNEGTAYIEIPTPVSMRSGDGVPVIIGAKNGLVYHASGLKDATYGVVSFGANSVTISASGLGITNQVCSGCFANKVFLSKEL